MFWVATEICSETNVVKRVRIIKQFIKIASECSPTSGSEFAFSFLSDSFFHVPSGILLAMRWWRPSCELRKTVTDPDGWFGHWTDEIVDGRYRVQISSNNNNNNTKFIKRHNAVRRLQRRCVSNMTHTLYILNKSPKNKPILITFGVQNHVQISRRKIVHSLTQPEHCRYTTLWQTTHLTLVSGQSTPHTNLLLSEPPTYYWKRLL